MADLPGGHGTGRDDLDAWLNEPVRPLPPPPEAFEQIRRRARRRKLRHAAWSATGAALLITAGVTVPRLVIPQLSPGHPIAANTPHHGSHNPAQPTTGPTGSGGLPSPMSGATSPVIIHPSAPPNFQPTSVTFVSPRIGWVIGQAGYRGHCGPPDANICTSVARTDDAGHIWYGVKAPVTGPPQGPRGVGQIRFLDGINGWAFGPELWATHDAGQDWHQIPTSGLRVTALETSNGRAFAVWARCSGTAAGAGGGCTSFSLYSAAAGTDRWKPVRGATGLTASGAPAAARLVLTQAGVYLLAPGGELLTGPLTGTGMHPVTSGTAASCSPGAPHADGQPTGALLASTGPDGTGLVLLCPGTRVGSVQQKVLYYSADAGATWRLAGSAPPGGIATSLAGSPSGAVVLATTRGIDLSASPGAPWRAAGIAALPGGFSYVGMTTSRQGVAVPADVGLHEVWFSYDGGRRWQESAIP